MEQGSYEPLGVGVGTLIAGRYDIVRKIGSGGMSAVFQVLDRALNNETVALKLFDSRLTQDKVQFQRFQNEVLITRKLAHPNIVRAYDFGQAEGHYFMTMEYLKGVSLERILEQQGALRVTDALRVLHEILKGVEYAHQNDVIHRDLKPGNVLVTSEGDVKIADFGLARTEDVNMRLTQAGECVGTPHYMAPEQIQERESDHRVDIYALGIMAYEFVTGAVPFSDKSWFDLASKIIKEPLPEIKQRKASVPPWYQEFVKKASSKNPKDRFFSAAEMIDIIAEHISRESAGVPAVLAFEPHETRRQKQRNTLRRNSVEARHLFRRPSLFQLAPVVLGISLTALVTLLLFSAGDSVTENVGESLKQHANTINQLGHDAQTVRDFMMDLPSIAEKARRYQGEQSGYATAPILDDSNDSVVLTPQPAEAELVDPVDTASPSAAPLDKP